MSECTSALFIIRIRHMLRVEKISQICNTKAKNIRRNNLIRIIAVELEMQQWSTSDHP